MDSKFIRRRWLWLAVGIIAFAGIAVMVRPFFSMLIVGMFFYYVARPIFHVFTRVRFLPRLLAAFMAVFFVLFPALVIVVYTGTVAVGEINTMMDRLSTRYGSQILDAYRGVDSEDEFYRATSDLVRNLFSLPAEKETTQEDLDQLAKDKSILGRLRFYVAEYMTMENIAAFAESARSKIGINTIMGGILFIIAMLLGFLMKGFLALLFAFLFLHYEKMIKNFIRRRILDDDPMSLKFLRDVDSQLESVFLGTILTIVVSGILAALCFYLFSLSPLLNIPYPVLLGLMCGVASLLPIVGMKLVYVPLILYLLVRVFFTQPFLPALGIFIVFTAVVLLVVDAMPEALLRPFLVRLPINIMLVMFAYIFGLAAFKELGIFLGPIFLILTANFIRTIWPTLRKNFI